MNDVFEHLSATLGGPGPDEARWGSALRLRFELQPAGGPGTKVMPPTYAGAERDDRRNQPPVYVHERRYIDGLLRECVLLDSVASQANRMEEALNERVLAGEIPLPLILVDQHEFGLNSALQFSHRCFDAWVEDALRNGEPFGSTDLYRELAKVSSRHRATPLIEHFPVALVLGAWASRQRDPQGTTRVPRVLISEIVAVGAELGERPASKVDMHHVSSAVKLYRSSHEGERITTDPAQARKTKKGEPEPLRPSEAGYGNVTPGLASHGGITMDHALQISTVSLPGLRECRFPADGVTSSDRDLAGRVMLAALAVRMLALLVEAGYDLRSGCLLTPAAEPELELVGRLGATVASWPLFALDSQALLERAIAQGSKHGLRWEGQRIELEASPSQLELLSKSLADESDSAEA